MNQSATVSYKCTSVCFVVDRDPEAGEEPGQRSSASTGHDEPQMRRLREAVHTRLLARGRGPETRLQEHPNETETHATVDVSRKHTDQIIYHLVIIHCDIAYYNYVSLRLI